MANRFQNGPRLGDYLLQQCRTKATFLDGILQEANEQERDIENALISLLFRRGLVMRM